MYLIEVTFSHSPELVNNRDYASRNRETAKTYSIGKIAYVSDSCEVGSTTFVTEADSRAAETARAKGLYRRATRRRDSSFCCEAKTEESGLRRLWSSDITTLRLHRVARRTAQRGSWLEAVGSGWSGMVGQSRVRPTNGGGRSWSAMTRALSIPANRAIQELYSVQRYTQARIYVYGVGVLRDRCCRRADFNGETVSVELGSGLRPRAEARTIGVGGRGCAASAAAAKCRGNWHRLLGRACIAQARPRWPVHPCPRIQRIVVVVVGEMEARSVPIDTPAAAAAAAEAEYRPWRLPPLSRVTRPEVNASRRQVASRVHRRPSPVAARPAVYHGDDKRGRDRVRGAWCETRQRSRGRGALSPPLNPLRGKREPTKVRTQLPSFTGPAPSAPRSPSSRRES
ncbi:hypothetical protein DBV15_03267 [Temnothorax longispinosus]|uniref:Uncharacterized protein n=1 Tax=Temnothorax longispinosus TaxID=300112 RepID=A0A4S2JR06_9HYME|nr:hypothetical protein DBV15_03267 [Temnothorax longispinosus]